MTFDELKEKAHALPLKPGVYIMQDKHNEVIYVGKAKALPGKLLAAGGQLEGGTESGEKAPCLVAAAVGAEVPGAVLNGGEAKSCFVVLHYIEGDLAAKDMDLIETPMEGEEGEAVSYLLSQYYAGRSRLPKQMGGLSRPSISPKSSSSLDWRSALEVARSTSSTAFLFASLMRSILAPRFDR